MEDAHTIGEITACAEKGSVPSILLPADRAFAPFPAMKVTEEEERSLRYGRPVTVSAETGLYRVYAPDGGFLMLGRAKDGQLVTEKSFYEVGT